MAAAEGTIQSSHGQDGPDTVAGGWYTAKSYLMIVAVPLRASPCGGKVCLANVQDACHADHLRHRPRDSSMIAGNRAAGWQRTRRCYGILHVARKGLKLVMDRDYFKSSHSTGGP